MEGFAVALLAAVLIVFFLGLSFLLTSLVIWLICWAFALTFTWKFAFGAWLVLCLLRTIFSVTVKKD